MTNAGDGSDRLFVVERRGTDPGRQGRRVSPACSSTCATRCRPAASAACSALAFHPRFETNRHVFVFYTRNWRRHRRRSLHRQQRRHAWPPRRRERHPADHRAQRPTATTTAAALAFGPDGYLYVGDRRRRRQRRPGRARPGHRPATSSARSCASTSTAPGAGPYGRVRHPVEQSVRRAKPGRRRDLGVRAAQPVAHLLRSGDRRAVHRRRRPGPRRGGRPRSPAGSTPAAATTAGTIMEGRPATDRPRCPLAG